MRRCLRWVARLLLLGECLAVGCGGEETSLLRKVAVGEMASQLSDEPGSYEWFNFYAEEDGGRTSLSAIFFPANLFDCAYRKAVREWQADPANAPRPRPSDFWLLQVNLTVDGKKVFTNLRRWPDATAEFPADQPRGRIGNSTFQWTETPDGPGFLVRLEAPDMTNDSRLVAEMDFRTSVPGFAVSGGIYGPIPGGERHQWQFPLGLPRTRVTLRVDHRDGTPVLPERSFTGGGYVDHMWGRGLLGDVLGSWDFGTTPMPDGGRVIHVWLTPADPGVPSHGWVFRVSPGRPARAFPIQEVIRSEPRTGVMGLPFSGDLRMVLDSGGSLRVRFGEALGEDWPFQVSGASVVDVDLPGDVHATGLSGVAEYLLQAAIDDEGYCQAAAIIDLLEWKP